MMAVRMRGAGLSDLGLVVGTLLLATGVAMVLGYGAALALVGTLVIVASYLAGR